MHPLCTHCIRNIHRASAHWFELHKTFRTDEPYAFIRYKSEQQTFYVSYHPLNVRCVLSASSGHPPKFTSAVADNGKKEEG
jgi:hypothetical protein